MVAASVALAAILLASSSPPAGSIKSVNAAQQAAPGSGCAGHLAFVIDRSSFSNNGAGRTFRPEQLAAFRQRAGRAFASAANALCSRGVLRPRQFSSTRRLLIQTASGAAETAVYSEGGGATLVFQWVFAEAGLALPPARDIQEGIRCWVNPSRQVCAERVP